MTDVLKTNERAFFCNFLFGLLFSLIHLGFVKILLSLCYEKRRERGREIAFISNLLSQVRVALSSHLLFDFRLTFDFYLCLRDKRE